MISVADIGIGVEVDDADEIVANLFATKPESACRSLPVSRAIAQTLGVRIAMASNAPRGSFTFVQRVTEAD